MQAVAAMPAKRSKTLVNATFNKAVNFQSTTMRTKNLLTAASFSQQIYGGPIYRRLHDEMAGDAPQFLLGRP
jgi:hypothetical protein